LGGYASVPMARAAARRRLPLVLLEQNAVAGKAIRWLARRAALVCASFPETAGLSCRCPVRVTGNPVRRMGGERRGERGEGNDECGMMNDELPRTESDIHHSSFIIHHSRPSSLLVLGGSGGARSLNENVPRALYKVRGQLEGWNIVHQSGEADCYATRTLYAKLDLPATVVPFLGDMPKVLSAADMAVCRAGGTTLAELATAAVPALLLPYPHATDDHQAANARHYAAGGGCVTIDEREVAGRLDDQLADMLCFLLANDALRVRMAGAMRDLARPNAADDVAEMIWSIVSSRSLRSELAAA
jgi:UDP-N-acetylglucosamine--N-acetylmuramyl-(pentapeptide) pyrophosphoryl-undecaprenol N-acetylglucosamine transferase